MKRRIALSALFVTLLLGGCSFLKKTSTNPLDVSGGKSATVAISDLAYEKHNPRPSGILGIFTSTFLSQGIFFASQSGIRGVTDTLKVLSMQEQPLNDNTFLMLQQLGDTLAVNVPDMLNRNPNRITALDQYSESLGNLITNADQKVAELAASQTTLTAQQKTEQTAANVIQKEVDQASKLNDFSTAGSKQQDLLKAQSKLAETQLKLKQTKDMLTRLKAAVTLAKARQSAIQKNREIILSGLSIVDLPGAQNLGIIKNPSSKGTTTNLFTP
ncbi:MAG: hypothetical protein WCG83_07020 [Candidatus Peregrinibacteria bacterium]